MAYVPVPISAAYVAAITPDDDDDLPGSPLAIRADTGGTVVVLPLENADEETITLVLADGEIPPIRIRRVLATGTDGGVVLHALYAAKSLAS